MTSNLADRFQTLHEIVKAAKHNLAPGPWGYRVHVVDYDSSTGTLYRPIKYRRLKSESDHDPFEERKGAFEHSFSQASNHRSARLKRSPPEFFQRTRSLCFGA